MDVPSAEAPAFAGMTGLCNGLDAQRGPILPSPLMPKGELKGVQTIGRRHSPVPSDSVWRDE